MYHNRLFSELNVSQARLSCSYPQRAKIYRTWHELQSFLEEPYQTSASKRCANLTHGQSDSGHSFSNTRASKLEISDASMLLTYQVFGVADLICPEGLPDG